MRRRWLPVVLVVVGLVAVGFAASGTGLHVGEREVVWQFEGEDGLGELSQEIVTESPPELVPEGEVGDSSLPAWLSWLLLSILLGVPVVLILVVLARKFVWWLVDSRRIVPSRDVESEQVRRDMTLVQQAVEAGLSEIDLGTDPRSAIMACWVHFEAASEAVGIERESSDTPADLVRKLLEHHELEGDSLERLSEAYLLARYSPHEVTERDRDTARAALIDLQGQLGVREVR